MKKIISISLTFILIFTSVIPVYSNDTLSLTENTDDVLASDESSISDIATLVLGDCNGDGILNSKDILMMKQYFMGEISLDTTVCDVNVDGVVDSKDTSAMSRIISNNLDDHKVVAFDLNFLEADEQPEIQIVSSGDTVVAPKVPERAGFQFAGWFLDENESDWTNSFDFKTAISQNLVLHAIWIDVSTDSDNDGIPDTYELYRGTGVNITDSDSDGLDDYYELMVLRYDPLNSDTDGDGVPDADADADTDGLNNLYEYKLLTDPINDDSDGDGLLDYDEVNVYGSDPLIADTDGDGVIDGEEKRLQSDPLSKETVFTESAFYGVNSYGAITPIEVSVDVAPEQVGTLDINLVSPAVDTVFSPSIPGYIDNGYDITLNGEFDTAEVKFKYDTANIICEEFQPRVYYFNEETQMFEELPNQIVENGIVSVNINHFSKYILLNKYEYDNAWNGVSNVGSLAFVDFNDDKLNDKYAEMIYNGEILLSNGSNELKGFDLNSSSDYDGDGLLNGEEIEIVEDVNRIYVKMKSNPLLCYSDGDLLSDYDEIAIGTDPLVTSYYSNDMEIVLDDSVFAHEAVFEDESSFIDETARNLWSTITFNWSHVDETKDILCEFFQSYSNLSSIQSSAEKIEKETVTNALKVMASDLSEWSEIYDGLMGLLDKLNEKDTVTIEWYKEFNEYSQKYKLNFEAKTNISVDDGLGIVLPFATNTVSDLIDLIESYSLLIATQAAFEENIEILNKMISDDISEAGFVRIAAIQLVDILESEQSAFLNGYVTDFYVDAVENIASVLLNKNPFILALDTALKIYRCLDPRVDKISEASYSMYVIDGLVHATKDLFEYNVQNANYWSIEPSKFKYMELLIWARINGGKYARIIRTNQTYVFADDDKMKELWVKWIDSDEEFLLNVLASIRVAISLTPEQEYICAHSLDEIRHIDDTPYVYVNGDLNKASNLPLSENETGAIYWGWVAGIKEIKGFSYSLDDGERVFDESFSVQPEDTLLNHVKLNYITADDVLRFRIPIQLNSRSQIVRIFVEFIDGTIEQIWWCRTQKYDVPFANTHLDMAAYDQIRKFDDTENVYINNSQTCAENLKLAPGEEGAIYYGWLCASRKLSYVCYQIDDGELITDESFMYEAEQEVWNHVAELYPYSVDVQRYRVPVPLKEGTQIVRIIAVFEDNSWYSFWYCEATVLAPTDDPEIVTLDEILNYDGSSNVQISNGSDSANYIELMPNSGGAIYKGWVGTTKPVKGFSYSLDSNERIYSDIFEVELEQELLDAHKNEYSYCVDVARFEIKVPLNEGAHTVQIFVEYTDGTWCEIWYNNVNMLSEIEYEMRVNGSTEIWNDIAHVSYDLIKNYDESENVIIGTDTNKTKNIAIVPEMLGVIYTGWIATAKEIEGFSFSIDGGAVVSDSVFLVEPEQDVITCATNYTTCDGRAVADVNRFVISVVTPNETQIVRLYVNYIDGTSELFWVSCVTKIIS